MISSGDLSYGLRSIHLDLREHAMLTKYREYAPHIVVVHEHHLVECQSLIWVKRLTFIPNIFHLHVVDEVVWGPLPGTTSPPHPHSYCSKAMTLSPSNKRAHSLPIGPCTPCHGHGLTACSQFVWSLRHIYAT